MIKEFNTIKKYLIAFSLGAITYHIFDENNFSNAEAVNKFQEYVNVGAFESADKVHAENVLEDTSSLELAIEGYLEGDVREESLEGYTKSLGIENFDVEKYELPVIGTVSTSLGKYEFEDEEYLVVGDTGSNLHFIAEYLPILSEKVPEIVSGELVNRNEFLLGNGDLGRQSYNVNLEYEVGSQGRFRTVETKPIDYNFENQRVLSKGQLDLVDRIDVSIDDEQYTIRLDDSIARDRIITDENEVAFVLDNSIYRITYQ